MLLYKQVQRALSIKSVNSGLQIFSIREKIILNSHTTEKLQSQKCHKTHQYETNTWNSQTVKVKSF